MKTVYEILKVKIICCTVIPHFCHVCSLSIEKVIKIYSTPHYLMSVNLYMTRYIYLRNDYNKISIKCYKGQILDMQFKLFVNY